MIVVTNAGPLIALAQIGQFDLLRLLYGQVHIPLLDQLVARGFRMGKELYQIACSLADESN
jgi:predicted nucleic acid-binding protein